MSLVGYLPDEPMFYEHLRGGEIARFCGRMRGMPDRVVTQRLDELSQRLAFADALDEYAVNYSMGMRKKLALACAMLHACEDEARPDDAKQAGAPLAQTMTRRIGAGGVSLGPLFQPPSVAPVLPFLRATKRGGPYCGAHRLQGTPRGGCCSRLLLSYRITAAGLLG